MRRAHAQARPILADILGGLEGDAREQYLEQIGALVAGISAGRFSLAWQYPRVITDGMHALGEQRRESAEVERARRALEQRRKKVGDALRDAGGRLAPDVIARLHRAVRSAATADAVDTVAGEVEQTVAAARNNEERRRDREIDRTRTRMRRTLPGAQAPLVTETWQDVLRRYAESQEER